jgi:hypothetical protein
MVNDKHSIKGKVKWELRGPDGKLKASGERANIITQTGNEYYAERAAGIASPPGQVTGMKLGTGTTAVATTGAGAALVTYETGSHAAITGGFPTSSAGSGTSIKITWKSSWAAGVATDTALAEAVLVIDTLADATSNAANTIARVLLSPTINKGASDTLDLTWEHSLGA